MGSTTEEVDKLLASGCIEKATCPSWVSNAIMVHKANDKWRMCIDYTNPNKACLKDAFPLPKIDRLVDSCIGESYVSFLDVYSDYHQIHMNPRDRECTAFCTDKGLYQFVVMPFGLKNAGATFQHLINFIFKGMIEESVEAYMDDMIVKGSSFHDHLANLELVFQRLRKYRMKFNPAKCIFATTLGRFLGFMISPKGIEANPDKITAIKAIEPPHNLKTL